MKSICIFCGAKSGTTPIYTRAGVSIAALLATHQIELIYGGGKVGLMGVLADTMIAQGGRVQGVIPQGLVDEEVAHTGLTELHVVNTMHQRKELMYKLSDGFIALPGGFGTLDEFFEILTWSQLGLHKKPIGFLNTNGFFDHLINHFEHIVSEGFVEQALVDRIVVEEDEGKLLHKLENNILRV
jgi:uncharacterized protein (TIGR00730 family)